MPTKHLLLIDDDETIQTVVQFGLRLAAGWQVQVASSGAQGIAIAQTEPLDAILLDMMMAEMDGLTTLRSLQAHPVSRQIPVLLLTATNPQTANWAAYPNLRGILYKPFNALELPEQIMTLLQW